jgi:hypothetical protein
MRKFSAIALMILAACQSTDAVADNPGPGLASDSEILRYSELDFQIEDWLTAIITDRCGPDLFTIVNKTCAKHVLIAAFDAGNEANDNCHPDTFPKDLVGCILYGSIGQKLLGRPGVTHLSFDWQAPLTDLKAMLASIADHSWMECAGLDSDTGISCYRLGLVQSLGLPDEATCVEVEESRLTNCLFEALLRDKLQEAALRTGTIF